MVELILYLFPHDIGIVGADLGYNPVGNPGEKGRNAV